MIYIVAVTGGVLLGIFLTMTVMIVWVLKLKLEKYHRWYMRKYGKRK